MQEGPVELDSLTTSEMTHNCVCVRVCLCGSGEEEEGVCVCLCGVDSQKNLSDFCVRDNMARWTVWLKRHIK